MNFSSSVKNCLRWSEEEFVWSDDMSDHASHLLGDGCRQHAQIWSFNGVGFHLEFSSVRKRSQADVGSLQHGLLFRHYLENYASIQLARLYSFVDFRWNPTEREIIITRRIRLEHLFRQWYEDAFHVRCPTDDLPDYKTRSGGATVRKRSRSASDSCFCNKLW